jgi:hypothetical protein
LHGSVIKCIFYKYRTYFLFCKYFKGFFSSKLVIVCPWQYGIYNKGLYSDLVGSCYAERCPVLNYYAPDGAGKSGGLLLGKVMPRSGVHPKGMADLLALMEPLQGSDWK